MKRGPQRSSEGDERTIQALHALPAKSAYLDGELCALSADGVPVFSRLQAAMDEGRTDQLVFFAFDLLFLLTVANGYAKVFDATWGENAMLEGRRLYFCSLANAVLPRLCQQGTAARWSAVPTRRAAISDGWIDAPHRIVGGSRPFSMRQRTLGLAVGAAANNCAGCGEEQAHREAAT